MDKSTQALAGFTASLRFEDLDARTVHETKRRVLDSIACGAGAFP